MWTIEKIREKDQQDKLSRYKKEFYIKDDWIYMDGNSLGLLSKRSEQSLHNALKQWKEHAIDGWTEGEDPWFSYSEELGKKVAKLVGANAHEVIVAGSITTNIHQMLSTLYYPTTDRHVILVDELNFPSDIYAVESHLKLRGQNPEKSMRKVPSRDGYTLTTDDIVEQLTEDVAVLLLPSVLYRSGQLLDMKAITNIAHEKGILVGFDLAHSIGSVIHELHDWDVDFAIWCHYKYVNSGPGGTAGLFIHERHHAKQPGMAGWFGSDKQKQFDMSHTFTKAEGAGAYQIGTPHIFSTAPLKGSLELFEEVGMAAIREKSLDLTTVLRECVAEQLAGFGFEMVTPLEDAERGGHIALAHSDAARICKALKARNVIPDFRAPNIIRLAPISFYSSYEDVWEMVQRLKLIMENEEYKQFSNERNVVA